METTEFHFDATTLMGDLRDAMLGEIKDAADGKPWNTRPEVQQRAVVDRMHSAARAMVTKAVLLMSNKGFASLHGELVQVQVKDGFKAVVEIPRGADFRHELVDAAGKEVVLVLASTDDFRGTRGAVPITPPAPLLDYAEEAARVADAAEKPPEGWTPEPGPDEDATEEAPPPPENPAPAQPEEPAEDEGVVNEDPSIRAVLQDVPPFHVQFCSDGVALWHCWRHPSGEVRCHEHADAARLIATRHESAWEDEQWETAEDRQAKKRKRTRGDEDASPEAPL